MFIWAMTVLFDLSFLILCFCHLELEDSSDTSFYIFATREKDSDAQKDTIGISDNMPPSDAQFVF